MIQQLKGCVGVGGRFTLTGAHNVTFADGTLCLHINGNTAGTVASINVAGFVNVPLERINPPSSARRAM